MTHVTRADPDLGDQRVAGGAVTPDDPVVAPTLDVDLDPAVLRVRDTKFGKSRLVPVAPDVATRLHRCRAEVARHIGPREPDAPFFPAPSGRRYSLTALEAAFHQVRSAAGIPRKSGGRSLRLHDLRPSFVAL